MRKLIIFLVLILGSVWLGLVIEKDPGYALFAYQTWSVETPLWFIALLWLVSLALCYFLLWGGRRIFSLKQSVQHWNQMRSLTAARQRLYSGLLMLVEGRWSKAEKQLTSHVSRSEEPVLNYLAAAFTAQRQGDMKRRDEYLRKAHDMMPDAEIAIGVTQAQLQVDSAQYEQALASLRHVYQLVPQHPYVLRLLYKTYVALGDWHSVRNLLPELAKRKVFSREELQACEKRLYLGLFTALTVNDDLIAVQKLWLAVPKYLRLDVDLVSAYVTQLLHKQAHSQAQDVLQRALQQDWHSQWLSLYGDVNVDNLPKQLQQLEKWLHKHPQDAELLFCAGRVAARMKLWGKAQSYWEASANILPQVKTYHALAKLCEQLGEKEQAYQHLIHGMNALA